MILNFFNFLKRKFLQYYLLCDGRVLLIIILFCLPYSTASLSLWVVVGLKIIRGYVIFYKNYITDLEYKFCKYKSMSGFYSLNYNCLRRRFNLVNRQLVYVSKQLEKCRKRNKFLRALLMKKRIKRVK